jgi:cytochrome c peroxidase
MHGTRAALVALGFLCVAGCSRSEPPPTPAPGPFTWRLPPGIPTPRVPADNPMTIAKVDLGRRLFYDRRLSGNQTYACASCHQQVHAFTDQRAHAVGSTGALHARSAMSLTNVAFNASFGWADPSLRTLEQQMAVPMFNEHPIELGLKGREAEIVARFASRADVARFRAAFADDEQPVSMRVIVKAIAAFERTLVSGDSPLDRYLYRDDKSAMTPAALRGMKLFFSDRLLCARCHGSFNLSGPVDFEGARDVELVFHDNSLYNVDGRGGYPDTDRGLFDITRQRTDMGKFRVPTLRNIAVTAPYMHDGSIATLEGVLDHYASGGHPSPFRSDGIRPFRLVGTDKADLLAFLDSLTDRTFLTNTAFSDPSKP